MLTHLKYQWRSIKEIINKTNIWYRITNNRFNINTQKRLSNFGLVTSVLIRNILIINIYTPKNEMGDANAKIVSENSGKKSVMVKETIGEANENGEMFLGFCTQNSLMIGHIVLPYKRIHKITWISPDG